VEHTLHVLAAFQNPQEYVGKKIGMSGDKMTITEYAAVISSNTLFNCENWV